MIPIVTPDEMGADRPRRAGTGRGADRSGRCRRRPRGRATCSAGPTAGGSSWSPARATTATTAGSPPGRCAGGASGRRVRRRGIGARASSRPCRPGDRRGVRHRLPRALRRCRRPPTVHRCSRSTSRPGVDGLTGEVPGPASRGARRTVTFAALKPGLLLGAGPAPGRRGRGGRHRPRRLDRQDAPGRGCRRRRRGCPSGASTTTSGTTRCG